MSDTIIIERVRAKLKAEADTRAYVNELVETTLRSAGERLTVTEVVKRVRTTDSSLSERQVIYSVYEYGRGRYLEIEGDGSITLL